MPPFDSASWLVPLNDKDLSAGLGDGTRVCTESGAGRAVEVQAPPCTVLRLPFHFSSHPSLFSRHSCPRGAKYRGEGD